MKRGELLQLNYLNVKKTRLSPSKDGGIEASLHLLLQDLPEKVTLLPVEKVLKLHSLKHEKQIDAFGLQQFQPSL